jgi:hypothetical protein
MPYRTLEVQPTPNPNAAKFVLDKPISAQPISFFNAAAANGHPLALQLFAIKGVQSLLLLGDFLTVNKSPDSDWKQLTPQVKQVLAVAE